MIKTGTNYSGLVSQINQELNQKQAVLTAGAGVSLNSDTLSLKVGAGLELTDSGYLISRTSTGVEWLYYEYTVSTNTKIVTFNLPSPCANINSLTILVDGKTAIPVNMIDLSNEGLTVTITSVDDFDANTVLACKWTTLTNLQPQIFLLSPQWSDYIVNDISWLRADTFSWHSGNVYVAAYEHLTDDITGQTPTSTDTYGEISISYIRAADGHKICLPDQESNLTALYQQEGVAWYYIVDTTNTRFKLPRTKYSFNGLRGNSGDYVAESLPNITGKVSVGSQTGIISTVSDQSEGAFYADEDRSYCPSANQQATGKVLGFDASRLSSTYQDGAQVQQRGTQMYLYFFVGNYERNMLSNYRNIDYIINSYNNNTDWYKVYKSGWVEQGGKITATSGVTSHTFLLPFEDSNYNFSVTPGYSSSSNSDVGFSSTMNETTFSIYTPSQVEVYWRACGRGASS